MKPQDDQSRIFAPEEEGLSLPEAKAKVERLVKLPLSEAVKISMRSLKIRLGRSAITTSGVLLGIAFLMAILTSGAIMASFGAEVEEEVLAETRARQVWLVTISLLVSVIGITNSMLMAVTERYREIGTMKCLGALDRFVVELFLLESSFQGLLGSIIGSFVGVGTITALFTIKYGLVVIKNFPWLLVSGYTALAISLGVILAIIGAIYPAYRAAKMPPAEAMRVEV